ncbi:MAG: ribonuclease P protein component [Candidatus Goldbacteria bacterium]|nr:ribonuclease P protein component [Candidatus Goldiibacteriota bacterium]
MYKYTPKTRDIKNLIKNGRKKSDNYFIVYYLKNNAGKTRFFIANLSKKIIPKSSDRNLIKRRIKTILNKRKNSLKNLDVLIISGHKISTNVKFNELEKRLFELLKGIGEK